MGALGFRDMSLCVELAWTTHTRVLMLFLADDRIFDGSVAVQ